MRFPVLAVRRAHLIVLAALLVAVAGPARATESEEQIRTQIHLAAQNQFRSDVDSLEASCKRYVDPKERTPSGVWKLTFFQYGIDAELGRMLDHTPRGREQAFIDEQLRKWDALYPESTCASITRARAYISVAWNYRGGGYAHTVPQEAWPTVRLYMEKARSELMRTKETGSLNPDWYATMIEVAKVQQWSDRDFETLLDEGISRHRLYFQMYFDAMQALLPKWRGDGEALERFARRAMRETGGSEGLSVYARVYWSVVDDYRDRLFIDSKANWPLLRRGFQEMLALYPDNRNRNAFALFACIAGDMENAHRMLEQIQDQVVDTVWVNHQSADVCRARAQRWHTARAE